MGAGTVIFDNNSGGRRAGPDGNRARRVRAGFLLVAEPVVAVGYGCRVASTDAATPWCQSSHSVIADGGAPDVRIDPSLRGMAAE